MAKITVIGGGYVGLVTSACFADLGHTVRCLEADSEKIALLQSGEMPIREPGLSEMWERHFSSGSLRVTDDPEEALTRTEFVFIAVGTPESEDGSADLSAVEGAVQTALKHSDLARTICIKSTVPPGTCAMFQEEIDRLVGASQSWTVVSNPEFLSQGRAVHDFLNPDRVVFGSADIDVSHRVAQLYSSLDAPVVVVDSTAAELVKYASNAFLALKISFINEISRLCERVGADVGQVATGVGMDNRIGHRFLEAGLGWGGSCFPKDTAALERIMDVAGVPSPIVSAARQVNASQVTHVVSHLFEMAPPGEDAVIAVLGLTFKDGTDDVRGSQAMPLIRQLLDAGYEVRVYDPVRPALPADIASRVTVCGSATEAALRATAAILATAWPELVSLDYSKVGSLMKQRVIVDARRALDPDSMRELGFDYYRPGDGSINRRGSATAVAPVPQVAA